MPRAATSRASPSRSWMVRAWTMVAGSILITDRDLRHDGEDGARQWIALTYEQPAAAVPFSRDRDLPVAAVGLHRRTEYLHRALLELDERRRARCGTPNGARGHLLLDAGLDAARILHAEGCLGDLLGLALHGAALARQLQIEGRQVGRVGQPHRHL